MLEYDVKKEKILLSVDTEVSDSTIINLIIMRLPSHIQSKLNTLETTSIKLLQHKFKKIETEIKSNEDLFSKSSNSNSFSKTFSNRNNNVTENNKFTKGKTFQNKNFEKKLNTIREKAMLYL